jgi:hypothetical protein
VSRDLAVRRVVLPGMPGCGAFVRQMLRAKIRVRRASLKHLKTLLRQNDKKVRQTHLPDGNRQVVILTNVFIILTNMFIVLINLDGLSFMTNLDSSC